MLPLWNQQLDQLRRLDYSDRLLMEADPNNLP